MSPELPLLFPMAYDASDAVPAAVPLMKNETVFPVPVPNFVTATATWFHTPRVTAVVEAGISAHELLFLQVKKRWSWPVGSQKSNNHRPS